MNKYLKYASIIIFLLSTEVTANQQLGRVLITYSVPLTRDTNSEMLILNQPPEIRGAIKSFTAYAAGSSEDIVRVELSAIDIGINGLLSRDGFEPQVVALRQAPGMSEFTHEVVDTYTSGYPSVRVKYKGKLNGTMVGGEILYAYEKNGSTAWVVSVIYSWKSGVFSTYRRAASRAESIINSVGII